MKQPLLAKPSGITLIEHTENVIAQGRLIIDKFPFVFKKYKRLLGNDLEKRLLLSCKYHDFGKAHDRWQTACRKDHQLYLDWAQSNEGDYYFFEKNNRQTAGRHLRTEARMRHEIASLLKVGDRLDFPIQIAIAAHHQKLGMYFEHRWKNDFTGKEAVEAYNFFRRFDGYALSLDDFQETILKVYEFAGVRSLLILADHRASRKESTGKLPNFHSFQYSFPKEWTRKPVQKIAEASWKDMLTLMRAPTGAGKTDAALLWAKKQIENDRADRLVIAMPTRFTSNALAINATEKLSSTGLYHSTAQFSEIYEQEERDKDLYSFSRKLLTPCTVCTIDHLLVALTLSKEDHHAILFNLANSCVVIDEADFYDEFTQANILVLLSALNILKVPVMVMSASLPEATLEWYRQSGYKLNSIKEDNSDYQRPRCLIKSIRNYENIEEIEDLLQECITEGAAIIYANTVAKAMDYFRWFENKGIKPILYHSRFIEPHKSEKERLLIDGLGNEAWANGRAHGIAILTQIGEMSVNISANLMISDLCPIDRLVQRAGRLCRFSEDVGQLHVVIPAKDGQPYPAPYGTFDRKSRSWIAARAYSDTEKILSCKEYSAGDFVILINEVYPILEPLSVKSQENAKVLKRSLSDNCIIAPPKRLQDDDVATDFWKSRDISGNFDILIELPPENYLSNYHDFQRFRANKGISVSSYLIAKAVRKHTIVEQTVKIGVDNEEKVYVLSNPNMYRFDIGLVLDESDGFL